MHSYVNVYDCICMCIFVFIYVYVCVYLEKSWFGGLICNL